MMSKPLGFRPLGKKLPQMTYNGHLPAFDDSRREIPDVEQLDVVEDIEVSVAGNPFLDPEVAAHFREVYGSVNMNVDMSSIRP